MPYRFTPPQRVVKVLLHGIAIYPKQGDSPALVAKGVMAPLTDSARKYIRLHKHELLSAFTEHGTRAIYNSCFEGFSYRYIKEVIEPEYLDHLAKLQEESTSRIPTTAEIITALVMTFYEEGFENLTWDESDGT